MNKVLIDTDVILDFFFDRKPFSKFATQIFSLCESKKIMGFVTPVMYSNVYYILKQTSRHDKVIQKLNKLFTITYVLQMDQEVVSKSLHSSFNDFEDALQNFSAIKSGDINVILTKNIKDYKRSEIGAMTPENYLKGVLNIV